MRAKLKYGRKPGFVPYLSKYNSLRFRASIPQAPLAASPSWSRAYTFLVRSPATAVPDSAKDETARLNWKLVLSYDGTDFHGWQVQPRSTTIQGELARAIHRVTGETVLPQGSGRTDAGVHALAQVASFSLMAPIPSGNLVRALNRTLPAAIRILSAEPVDATFHARHSAISKTYEYRILVADPFAGGICSPWQARFVYAVERPLQLEAMQQAASAVIGQHDFTSFAAVDPGRTQRMEATAGEAEAVTNVRVVHASGWSEAETGQLTYRVIGSGFLHHMVRNLVGTFLEVGLGERNAADVGAILAARQRAAAGRTAPARGLFLREVRYGP